MAHSNFEVSCIDLVLEYDPGSDELGIDVEGLTLNALRSPARLNPVGSPGQGELGSRIASLARSLDETLAELSA